MYGRKFIRWYTAVLIATFITATVPILSMQSCMPEPAYGHVPSGISVMILQPQQTDSLGFSVTWVHPEQGPFEYPIATYLVRVVTGAGTDTLAAGATAYPAQNDTVWMKPFPTLDSTYVYYAAVSSVDTAGVESGVWALSSTKQFTVGHLPPSPPDSVDVVPIPDTIPIVTHGTLLPETIALTQNFGTAEYEFLVMSQDVVVACVRAQLFELDPATETYEIAITSGGVCENRDFTGISPVFFTDTGVLVDRNYVIQSAVWSTNTLPAGDHLWNGEVTVDIPYPADPGDPQEVQLNVLRQLNVLVEDVE